MPIASRVKDAGSAHARIWEQSEIPPDRIPPEPPDDRSLTTDSYRFLVRRPEYPDANPPLSCFSISSLDEPDRSRYRDLVMSVAYSRPGDLVSGARNLPVYKSECMFYYTTAGFSPECAELLTHNLRRNPVE